MHRQSQTSIVDEHAPAWQLTGLHHQVPWGLEYVGDEDRCEFENSGILAGALSESLQLLDPEAAWELKYRRLCERRSLVPEARAQQARRECTVRISGQRPRTFALVRQCSMSCGTCVGNTNREHMNVVGFVTSESGMFLDVLFRLASARRRSELYWRQECKRWRGFFLVGFRYGQKRPLARDSARLHVIHSRKVVHDEATHA